MSKFKIRKWTKNHLIKTNFIEGKNVRNIWGEGTTWCSISINDLVFNKLNKKNAHTVVLTVCISYIIF